MRRYISEYISHESNDSFSGREYSVIKLIILSRVLVYCLPGCFFRLYHYQGHIIVERGYFPFLYSLLYSVPVLEKVQYISSFPVSVTSYWHVQPGNGRSVGFSPIKVPDISKLSGASSLLSDCPVNFPKEASRSI